ncbi:succinate dehydrogenase flavoprotein subunit [Blochmannia endosymbiont of Camponotus (Colobopsis) obliquus]|uniref:succinate dehydrogenase flavoprotein subunit n=1 Tax=Blochmannia endosymbiont of Camponotus (Colobopsis) obliquus TaxID=1505597 RepID=UPI00061A5318|nr:succinate dehydrogenase flavoprotein subunit [Blochmannia endosymbiont of Camponotus (Colobopsis) obliquus]AKC60493.1 Succinate dehydrogenase flavoprotein subunit [Blochmannia endosymbiont of Camponotus (Colobopsis) obliquus]
MNLLVKEFTSVVIGSGGAGMRVALQISQTGGSCALISKVFPTRSHTVSAQGGITVALGNCHEDCWEWHMYDTVKGSDYIGDQHAIEYMCKNGPKAILELEHMGMPFSRLNNGRIYQRPFGGQSINYGSEQASRTAAAADRTGHALLHTLYQQNLKNNTTIFSEWYAIDLVKNQDGRIVGCIALCIESGELIYFKTQFTVLATGGAGRIYKSTTNAYINTGDGIGMAVRAGIPVQDMEMWQFHPTGIAGVGILVTEGCRGEGGYLLNKYGERFMERYAPNVKDLASRDIISRSIMIEILEGRGCDENIYGPHVKLKLDHLGKKILNLRLPGILELVRTFAHIDPMKEAIPVTPTCHYMMGGIPTTVHGEVITLNKQGEEIIVPGLFAVGENACVSVHGANRLGGNSLLDLIVFGRSVGMYLQKLLQEKQFVELQVSNYDIEASLNRYIRWNRNNSGENPVEIRTALQICMQDNFSVFREEKKMIKGLKEIEEIRERSLYAKLSDHSNKFNTQRIECLELDNMIETAYTTALAANFRKESRGAHSRQDFPARDDENWLCHTLYLPQTNTMVRRNINNKVESCQVFLPKQRIY